MCVCKYTATTTYLCQALFDLTDRCQQELMDRLYQSLPDTATNISQGYGLGLDKDNSAHSEWTHSILTVVAPYMFEKCAYKHAHPSICPNCLSY